MSTGFHVSPQAFVLHQSDCSKQLMSSKVMWSTQVESASCTIIIASTVVAEARATKEVTTRAEDHLLNHRNRINARDEFCRLTLPNLHSVPSLTSVVSRASTGHHR